MNSISQPVGQERVLVVPTALFHRIGYFQGFSAEVDRYFPVLTDPANVDYRPRSEMEQDPNFKQLIPYVIFRHQNPADVAAGGPRDQTHLFHYTRGAGQGEQRLHAKRSIGVGGHICTTDQGACPDESVSSPYEEGLRRELEEEVCIETSYSKQCVGLINDDQTDVGRVHLGVVHLFDVQAPRVWARETDLLDAGFAPLSRLAEDIDSFETWSQICMRALFAENELGKNGFGKNRFGEK